MEQTSRWLVKLNDTYMIEWDEKTGYNDFGPKEKAILFPDADKALTALADIVWGGSDSPPELVEVAF